MKRKIAVLSLTIIALVSASSRYTPNASSNSTDQLPATLRDAAVTPNLMPAFVTTLSVDRADDTAAASACTAAPNDCSLRGAVRKANTTPGPDPVVINLQSGTTYNLTLSNANQENAAATGDLDITTSQHSVTIEGGGSSTIIDATGLNGGGRRDRVFHVTGSNVTAILRSLVIRNGQAGDDGTAGTSTNPTAQNTIRIGGGILNNSGRLTLEKVTVQSCQAIGKGDSIVNEHTTLDAFGGGLASVATTGNVTITDSTFTGNTASGGNGGNFNNGAGSSVKGGSIYFEGGTLHIDGSRILLSSAIGGNGGNGPGNQQNGGMGGIAQGGGAYIGGGAVSINDSTFKSCSATGGNSGTGQNGTNNGADSSGGALFSLGNVKVLNSTFALNSATGGNAGHAFGPDCFGGHTAGDGGAARGGGILAEGGSLIVNTATFAGNLAKGGNGGNGGQTNAGLNCGQHGAGGLAHGGALTNNAASVNITHATISLNEAKAGNTGVNQGGANKPPRPRAEGTGGGIRVGAASVTLENTIIANNTAANGLGDPAGAPVAGPNVDGTVTSNGHNLLGVATEAVGFGGVGDKINANPMLAALANNGGPTETMALQVGSAAIDAGVAAGASADQRGLPRTFNDPGVANAPTSDGTDIGAFERQPRQSRCDLCCPNNMTVPSDRGRKGAIVTYEMPEAKGCGRVKCDPPSGSFFPLGVTIVTCFSEAGPECSFKVTVKGPQISNPKE
jgi:fibronectin-binding autotransporter adhesin